MEIVNEYGSWLVVADTWERAQVIDRRTHKVVKNFTGELSEQNADRYAWDLYSASGEAW